MKNNEKPYKEMYIRSDLLEIPRNTYQRRLNPQRTKRIANAFDERIANEPKVSLRNGRYYVFDGQHTIAARVERNGGKPLPILCKLYLGMTESDEATLFSQQNGESADLTAGVKIRAKIYVNGMTKDTFDVIARLTASFGKIGNNLNQIALKLNSRTPANDAFNEFQRVGAEKYKEALTLLLEAWNGDPDSLRAETVTAMCRFVELYDGEYDKKRLIQRFRKYDPITIFRDGRSMTTHMAGYKRYLHAVWTLYNGSSVKAALPLKF